MDVLENTITCKQLPLWPLLLVILVLGGVSVELGMLLAAVLSVVALAVMSRLPDVARFTFTPENITMSGWIGAIPLLSTKTISRANLVVNAYTQAGEDNHCVHTITLSNAGQHIQLSGLHCEPDTFAELIERIKQPA
jgi:hypothetical protein